MQIINNFATYEVINYSHTLTFFLFQTRHTLEESDDQLDFSIPGPAHPHLLHLKVTGVVSDQRLRFLLSHAPALQTIHLDGELEWLHDGTLAAALQINPLPHLEVSLLYIYLFRFHYLNLAVVSV